MSDSINSSYVKKLVKVFSQYADEEYAEWSKKVFKKSI